MIDASDLYEHVEYHVHDDFCRLSYYDYNLDNLNLNSKSLETVELGDPEVEEGDVLRTELGSINIPCDDNSVDKPEIIICITDEEYNMFTGAKRKRSPSPPTVSIQRDESEIRDQLKSGPPRKKTVKCGVCNRAFYYESGWRKHAERDHCFIAWMSGDSFELDDPVLIDKLKEKINCGDALKCPFCDTEHKYLKCFLKNVRMCLAKLHEDRNDSSSEDKIVKCGVCHEDVNGSNWLDHIAKEHNYLAWSNDAKPLNVNDDLAVQIHLRNIIERLGKLKCNKCGKEGTVIKPFFNHIKMCDEMPPCAVCKQHVSEADWIKHIADEHGYLAWREGRLPLNMKNRNAIHQHLQAIANKYNGLTCPKCGMNSRHVKTYFKHLEKCKATEPSDEENVASTEANVASTEANVASTEANVVLTEANVASKEAHDIKCGVCALEVNVSDWPEHIAKAHSYIAWEEGEPPIEIKDETELKQHLSNMSKKYSGLMCAKCGLVRRYVKSYTDHIQYCDGLIETEVETTMDSDDLDKSQDTNVRCAVCNKVVNASEWFDHIQIHNYLAWRVGQPPLDLNNQKAIQQRLHALVRKLGKLVCNKCGVERKYVKVFLDHVDTCEANTSENFISAVDISKKDIVECGICHKQLLPGNWRNHAMTKHYNIAWIVGQIPIDVNNPYAVDKYLKEYKKHYSLACKICGLVRSSLMGFYAHVITCGKTDEETEIYKSLCDICNNKYLRIYKNQHMTAHREQEIAKERKLKKLELKEQSQNEEETSVPRGRRAAAKALGVIKNYKNLATAYKVGSHVCSSCGADKNNEANIAGTCEHTCDKSVNHRSDSDESVDLDKLEKEEDESDDSDVDSNLSNEEEKTVETKKKKRGTESHTTASKIQRIPFLVNDVHSYIKKTAEDFDNVHNTNESLFDEWRSCEYEPVSADQISEYLPQLEVSCKVKFFMNDDWITYNRFEVCDKYGLSLFVGASIQRISWVPPLVGDITDLCGHLLAVATHQGPDCPRYGTDELQTHPAAIQIWDFGDFTTTQPKLTLCIAHEYGTVWDLTWCPSGARDFLPFGEQSHKTMRLGLLAVACSNGFAYIFSVPYPSSMKMNEQLFFKLKPVAELRMSMNLRKIYQATTITWSTQKGHGLVVVGYSDGSTAFYDLYSDSSLLKVVQDSVTILYPYYDDKPLTSCITGIDVYPSANTSSGVSAAALCVSSVTGAQCLARPDSTLARLHSHLPASDANFVPHWPSVVLVGDDALMSQSVNELDWWGAGRRLGSVRAWCSCAQCGGAAVYAPPLLRAARIHPANHIYDKQTIGMLQMNPLVQKRNKRAKDELTTILEPTTYEDAVAKYGIEFGVATREKSSEQLILNKTAGWSASHERFPLADVPSMAFCRSRIHHSTLAVATHAGVLFVIDVIV